MPTITIEGRKVKVDDAFLSMSPDEQSDAVDEIAQSLKITVRTAEAPKQQATLGHKIGAAIDGVAQGLTFGTSDEIAAGLSTGLGFAGDYDKALSDERSRMAENRKLAGGYSLAGEIGGSLLPSGLLMRAGAKAAQVGSKVLPYLAKQNLRGAALRGGLGGASVGAAYGAGTSEGGLSERAGGALDGLFMGGAIGVAAPVVGAGLRHTGAAIRDSVMPMYRSIKAPKAEAYRRVGDAFDMDKRMPQGVLNSADESVASLNQQQLSNFDRGGAAVRGLTRSVANQSPESRGAIEKVVEDRFHGQGGRIRNIINRIAGGDVDDLAFQDKARQAAERSNGVAYRAAENSQAAQSMWHEGFEQLMQAPAMQKAAKEATTRGANRAAVDGFTPIRSPFNFDEAGRWTLKTRPDGSMATPNLRFWDQVKRNLDGDIGVAMRQGDKSHASDLLEIKRQLLSTLDDTVPLYKDARVGAAGFFDAEDALDAGRKFVMLNKNLREAERSIGRMTPAEKEAFQVGFAGELTDKLRFSKDRQNVVNQIFGSDAAKEKIALVFGKEGAKELEAFIKIETTMDMMRQALGGSTTTRQLAEMGLGAGLGMTQSDGSFSGLAMTGIAGAAAGKVVGLGRQRLVNKAQEDVMNKVAKILMSTDKSQMAKASREVARSKSMQDALAKFMNAAGQKIKTAGIQQSTANNPDQDGYKDSEPLVLNLKKSAY